MKKASEIVQELFRQYRNARQQFSSCHNQTPKHPATNQWREECATLCGLLVFSHNGHMPAEIHKINDKYYLK